MRTGALVLLSTAVSTPSGRSNPRSCAANPRMPAATPAATGSGRQAHKLAGMTPGRYVGVTDPKLRGM